MYRLPLVLLGVFSQLAIIAQAGEPPTVEEASQAMRKAASFFHNQVASQGGYVWRYSSDLVHRQGEGVASPNTIWVQPPGTPAVGDAFLEAYRVTKDQAYLKAAQVTGQALVSGQLRSGGWYYRVEFDPAQRREFLYRTDVGDADRTRDDGIGGWDVWRERKFKGNQTVLDDETTSGALAFLMRLDRDLEMRDEKVHDAAQYALASVTAAQYPIGAWSHNYDRFPNQTPSSEHYPVLAASYPEEWSRTWDKKFEGCYEINDQITADMIRTLLLAHDVYQEPKYLEAAKRGGSFLILAQLPDPQPAWAQQYNRHMHPVWERPFEPPAITGFESQDVLRVLLTLYAATGDSLFLQPVPKALEYLRACVLPDGNLARFYELKTNKPLYFTQDYKLTYDGSNVPDHYGFKFPSELDEIERDYRRLLGEEINSGESSTSPTPELIEQTRSIIDSQDQRGAWTQPGWVRNAEGRKVVPDDGVIESATFVANMKTLARFIEASR